MNTATVQGRRAPKHPPLADSSAMLAIATLRRYAKGKIFFADTLCKRWEQIVSKGRV